MRRANRWSVADTIMASCLWMLAATCGAFPFYVHFHRDAFGPPQMQFSGELDRRQTLAAQAAIQRDRIENVILRPQLLLDQMTTGSIAPTVNKKTSRVGIDQQDPAKVDPTLIIFSATPTRALANLDGKIIVLRIGDRLPDGKIIEGFKKVSGVYEAVSEYPEILQ